MKFTVIVGIAMLACVSARTLSSDDLKEREERAVATTAAIAKVAINVAKKLIGALLKNHYGDGTTADLAISGRAMQLKILSKENPAQVVLTDRSSKMQAMGTGVSLEDAIQNAAKAMVTNLLTAGHMSVHDLHLPPTPPTLRATDCADTHGDTCLDYAMLGYCSPSHHFRDFMMMNCKSTCGEC